MNEYVVLGSGSTGNAILVRGPQSILLDCGFPARELRRRIHAAGADASELAGIVLTHEHADHARGAPRLAQELGVPVVATPGTLAQLSENGFDQSPLEPGCRQELAGFGVEFFRVPHDAAEPVGVRVTLRDRQLGYLTDVGANAPGMVETLRGCHHLLIESNHDPDLLAHGPYPDALKRRIRGGHGHLSNDACGHLLRQIVTPQTQRVVLHHLSRYNNTPELALATNHAILHRAGVLSPTLMAAPPHGPFGPFPF